NLYLQALSELGRASDPGHRAAALARRANAASAAGDALGAALAAFGAAEMAELARTSRLRSEVASRLGALEAAPPPSGPVTRYREAGDAIPHRSIRTPREQ